MSLKQKSLHSYFKNTVVVSDIGTNVIHIPCSEITTTGDTGTRSDANHSRADTVHSNVSSKSKPSNKIGPTDISQCRDNSPVQPILKQYPKTLSNDKQRCFSARWFTDFALLEYSVINNMVYCFCCRNFSTITITSLVTGCQDWKNIGHILKSHFNSPESSHQFCLEKYTDYKSIAQTKGSVINQLLSKSKEDVLKHREVVAARVQVALLCARQDLPFRGHREKDETKNRGNFLEVLDLAKLHSPTLKLQESELPKHATYVSPQVQNEIIEIAGSVVRTNIINKVKEPFECFSIIADETRDNGGVEQLSICLRYPSSTGISERFVGFVDMHKFDAEAISDEIIKYVKEIGLNIKNCVAQCYDGASVMSGHLEGVQEKIAKEINGYCPYIHCHAHRVNLVLIEACKSVREVSELLGLLQSIYSFQSNSARRSEFFTEAQTNLNYESVLNIPQTFDVRWTSKKKGISYFYSRFDAVILGFKNILENGKPEESAECQGYLSQLNSFQKYFLLNVLDNVLGLTNILSVNLQNPDLLLRDATVMCESTVENLKRMRTQDNFDALFKSCFDVSKRLNLDTAQFREVVEPKRKKTATKKLRNYVVFSSTGSRESETTDPKAKLRSLYYQIIEAFIGELERRFTKNDVLYKELCADDPKCKDLLDENDVMSFCKRYSRFEFDYDALKNQIVQARAEFRKQKFKTTEQCYEYLLPPQRGYPDIFKYFAIVLALPVSNTTSEKSFSSLNRIKSKLRTRISERKISDLTILSVERDLSDELYNQPSIVVDRFANVSHRRLELKL